MIKLPDKYCRRMKMLLGDVGFKEYLGSFSGAPYPAIRINTAKVDIRQWKKICPFGMEEIPWCENGFIIDEAARDAISKHPYYYAGLYYIQEPSAMLPVSMLPIENGDKVLDLCAAPGGKAVEAAARLNGTGLLVANDISASRAMSLTKNLQAAGLPNILVTAETPVNLSFYFKGYFDKIILDVPCSGEGMFRKRPDMVVNWLGKGPGYYAAIQREILDEAYKMLKPGGNLVYSTCTFSIEEDEGMIQWFTNKYSDMEICAVPHKDGFSYGRPDMVDGGSEDLKKCIRIFPHIAKGEGHFASLLRKNKGKEIYDITEGLEKTVNSHGVTAGVRLKDNKLYRKEYGNKEKNYNRINKNKKRNKPGRDIPDSMQDNTWQREMEKFVDSKASINYCIKKHKNMIQLIPEEMAEIHSLRVLQNGITVGEVKKYFEPSVQLALSVSVCSYKERLEFSSTDINVVKYLKGETVDIGTGYKGWLLVTVDGFPLGWGKSDGQGRLKNKYYAGWRML